MTKLILDRHCLMVSLLVVMPKISPRIQWDSQTSMLGSKNSTAAMFLLSLTNIMIFSRADELWLSLSTAKLMHGRLQIVQTCPNQWRLKNKSNKNSIGGLWHIPPYSPEYTHGQLGACCTYLIECEMLSQVSSETLECGII